MTAQAIDPGWAPLAIAVAPNGARRTRADHPRLPMSPAEIARDARACLEAGACMLHLHVRDAAGGHTLDAQAYRAAIDAVRREVGDGLVVQVTTEAVGRYAPEAQMAVVRDLRPEAVSLAVRELIPDSGHERAASAFLQWCRRERISPQYILYDVADLAWFRDLKARGVVPGQTTFRLYVLGRYAAGQRSDPADLLPFLSAEGGREDPWALCAFGPREAACATAAAALGGHVRVGFENNLHRPDGGVADCNAALVAAATAGAAALGRPLAGAGDLRAWMAAWNAD